MRRPVAWTQDQAAREAAELQAADMDALSNNVTTYRSRFLGRDLGGERYGEAQALVVQMYNHADAIGSRWGQNVRSFSTTEQEVQAALDSGRAPDELILMVEKLSSVSNTGHDILSHIRPRDSVRSAFIVGIEGKAGCRIH